MNTGLVVLLAGLMVAPMGANRTAGKANRAVPKQRPAAQERQQEVHIGPWEARPKSGEAGGFVPDRRPVVHLPLFSGNLNNPGRLADWWKTTEDRRGPTGQQLSRGGNGVPDSMDNLLRRLDILYDRGFRRFAMKLPAGDPDIDRVPGRRMSSAQWWTMEDWRREQFTKYLGKWIDGKERAGDPVEVGVYMGYHVDDPYSVHMDNPDLFDTSFTEMSPRDAADSQRLRSMMVRYRQNIQPWIDAGISEFWFDNSSTDPNWPVLLRLANNPDYNQQAKFHGEAIPVTWGPCQFNPIEDAVRRGAWVETFKVAEYRHSQTVFDPALTEVHLWMSGHHGRVCASAAETARPWTFADLEKYKQNGWVLDPEFVFVGIDVWSKGFRRASYEYYSRNSDGSIVRNDGGGSGFLPGTEAVQRINDMGFISCIADFNGDGKIEVDPIGTPLGRDADLVMFDQRWRRGSSGESSGHTFAQGDVNNDGVIDGADYDRFMQAAQHYRDFRSVEANASALYLPADFCTVNLGSAD